MSYKAEVQVRGGKEKWHSNMLRFRTKEEAAQYGAELMGRWTLVEAVRVVEVEVPANHEYRDGKLMEL